MLLVSETIRAIASFECVSPQEPDPSSNSPLELLGKLDKRYAKYATDFTQFENIQVPLARSPVSYLLRTLGKPKLLCHIILTQFAPNTVWLHGRHLVGERDHGWPDENELSCDFLLTGGNGVEFLVGGDSSGLERCSQLLAFPLFHLLHRDGSQAFTNKFGRPFSQ